MANILLGWPNRIDNATLSGGSWSAGLPLTNLKTRSLASVARTSDAANASTIIIADLGASYSLRAIALVNHNLSQSATVAIKLGTSSGGSEVYNGADTSVWSITFGSGADEWAGYNWWSPMSSDEYIGNPFMCSTVLSQFYTARYVKIVIKDASNSAGYVQLGRVFIGGGLVPATNAGYGLREGIEDLSTAVDLESGATVVVQRRRRRTASFALDWLSQSAEFGVTHEMMRRLGIAGDVLYVPDTSDAVWTQRSGFLGRLRQLSPIAYPYPSHRSAAFEVIEQL